MKYLRKKAALLISVFCMLSFSGCTSGNSAEKIINRTSQLGTYAGTVNMNAELTMQGEDVICGMKSDIVVQTDPFFAKLNVATTTNDPNIINNFESNMYLKTENGVNTAYVGYNDEWYKQVIDSDDFKYAISQYNPVDNAVLFMESATSLTNVGSEEFNGHEVNKYQGKIPKDMICDIMQTTGSIAMIGQNISSEYYTDVEDLPITLYVNDEDGIIIGYSLDLKDLTNKLFSNLNAKNSESDESQKIEVKSFTCEVVLTDYNMEVDTVLPDNVLNSAQIVEQSSNENAETPAE